MLPIPRPSPDPAGPGHTAGASHTPRDVCADPTRSARASVDVEPADRRTLRRQVRLVRRHLGPGPYLDFGCGSGDLLAALATHGSATGFTSDAATAETARAAAPGCPVHTLLDALPSGVFRGVVARMSPAPDIAAPSAAALGVWQRVLAPGGRVLVIGAAAPAAAGFSLAWSGRERWRSGAVVVVLEALPGA